MTYFKLFHYICWWQKDEKMVYILSTNAFQNAICRPSRYTIQIKGKVDISAKQPYSESIDIAKNIRTMEWRVVDLFDLRAISLVYFYCLKCSFYSLWQQTFQYQLHLLVFIYWNYNQWNNIIIKQNYEMDNNNERLVVH